MKRDAFDQTRREGGAAWSHRIHTLVPIAWMRGEIATVASQVEEAYRDQGGTQFRLLHTLVMAMTGRSGDAVAILERTTRQQLDGSYSMAGGSSLSFPYVQAALALDERDHIAAAAE